VSAIGITSAGIIAGIGCQSIVVIAACITIAGDGTRRVSAIGITSAGINTSVNG
jgi:hypothetical protein